MHGWFRAGVAPGSAGPAGVPSDSAPTAAAELTPVFALLSPTEESCRAIRLAGRRAADELRRTSDDEATRLIDRARNAVEPTRAATVAAATMKAEQQHVEILAAVRQQAERLRERQLTALPAQVSAAIGQIREIACSADLPEATGPPR